MGGGLVVLNNIGQMVKSIGGTPITTTVLVSLISVANCLGRISLGVVSDALYERVPRQVFVASNLLLMLAAQLLISAGTMPTLCSGAVLAGFSYGGFWTLLPSLISELFGTANFATLYNCQALAVSSASLIFSTLLAGKIYDMQASLHPVASRVGCIGPQCFRLTAFVMAAASFAGVFVALAMLGRARRHHGPSCARDDVQQASRLEADAQ